MKKVYIIHAWGGSPNEATYKWLKASLEEKGVDVVIPKMPDTETPVIKAWVDKLNDIIENPDEETVLVGHSVGCQTILRYLEKLDSGVKVGGVVLIAPWFTLSNLEDLDGWDQGDLDIAEPWIKTPIDDKKVMNHTEKIVAIFSDNDPYVPFEENKKFFKERFGAEIIEDNGKGHFSEEEGITELPIALEKVLEILG